MSRDDNSVSFYFFDLDDNTFFLDTLVYLKNMKTGVVKSVTTHEFAEVRGTLGNSGPWKDFGLFEESYKNFRDRDEPGETEYLVEDIREALTHPKKKWQGPAFELFQYACEQQRPLGIVTARGHSRETIIAGIREMVKPGLLPEEPNYLQIYAVSNKDMVDELLDSITDPAERKAIEENPDPTSPLKRVAIRNIVEKALEDYGAEPPHRFGMSDDDPNNVDLIIKAMCECKTKYLDKRFFVINTHKGEHVKLEVFPMDFPVTRHAAPGEPVG